MRKRQAVVTLEASLTKISTAMSVPPHEEPKKQNL